MYPLFLAGPRGALRTYTDPISNTVFMTAANPLTIKEDLVRGRLDPHHLSTVMHEVTHYSCFVTPVGYSFAALLTAHTADRFGFFKDQDELEGPAAVAIRAQVASTYFAPLLEGLALFAEFDATPGSSPVASTVSSIGLKLFCAESYLCELTKRAAPGSPSEYFGAFLAKQRTSPDFLERKRALLAAPVTDDDGYVIGYLWVKSLWRLLRQACPKLADSDLFLSFMISFFFEDYRLACLLFNFTDAIKAEHDVGEYAEFIGYYLFVHRIEELLTNIQAYVDEYESYATGFAPGSLQGASPSRDHPSYQGYSTEAVAEINSNLAFASIRSMHWAWPEFLAARHVLRLFAHPATVSIDEGGHYAAICDDGHRIEGQVLEAGRPISGEATSGVGSVEAVMLTSVPDIILCIFLGRELIATIDPADGEENRKAQAESCDRLSSYFALEAAMVRIAEETTFREDSKAFQVARETIADARMKAALCYANLGLAGDGGEVPSEAAVSVVRMGGIAGLLADDPPLVGWLARLSLSGGGRMLTMSEASEDWGVNREDIKDLCGRLNEVFRAQLGQRAVYNNEEHIGFCRY